jgi:hypothetical protein
MCDVLFELQRIIIVELGEGLEIQRLFQTKDGFRRLVDRVLAEAFGAAEVAEVGALDALVLFVVLAGAFWTCPENVESTN